MRYIIFISIMLLAFTLFAETYTVKQDGTGDFTNIQEAVSSPLVVDGDEIIVWPGTYYENVTIDKNIIVASLYHTTGLQQYIESTTIDGSHTPAGSVITTVENLDDCLIEGFTIKGLNTDNGKGILIHNNSTKINNCIITDIQYGIYIDEYGEDFFSPVISNNLITYNYTGIYCDSSVIPQIISNEVSNNESDGIRFILTGVPNWDPAQNPLLLHNIIYNQNAENSAGIRTERSITVMFCCIYDNDYCYKLGEAPSINNISNTIVNNRYFLSPIVTGFIDITNCILRDNVNFLQPFLPGYPNPYTINYSCIQHTAIPFNGGIGVTYDDPLFSPGFDDYTLSWTETEKSPCIDKGDPESHLDPDSTRADMGAYYHPHEVKTYELPSWWILPDVGWKWLCFDILDKMIDPYNIAQNMLLPIRPDDLLDYAEFKDHGNNTSVERIEYLGGGNWLNGLHEFTSPYGYKFHTWDACYLVIPGFRCEATTMFFVAGNNEENWIGYFLEETQHVYDAFYGYLDNIKKIKTQHWSVKYNNGWPDVPYTLKPGDMVIVWCEEDIPSFSWVNDTPREPFNIEEPQSFSYEEESDYIPIYMSLDPEDLPTEIGAFVDGECQGATVVQDTSAQICAYIMENQGSSLEFEFYYGSRSENKVIREYNVYDPEKSQTLKGFITVEQNRDCYYVSFKDEPGGSPTPAKLEASNCPNPFNPETTIQFSTTEHTENTELIIYNIKGQKVKTLYSGIAEEGKHTVTWNGKDEIGKDVTSGIYFYKLNSSGKTAVKKMLLLK